MSKVSNDIPIPIKPYITLGLDLNYKPHLNSITTDCPFCGKEGKWNILVENGLWRCVYCNVGSENGKVSKGGNIITFQRLLWEKGKESTPQHDYTELSQHRSIEEETLIEWGLIKNPFNDEWLIPSFSTDGKLNTFYRYVEFRNKWQVVALPNSNHQLFGVNLFDNKKNNVVFCEGPWDAMSLWETLRHCKYKEQSNNREMIYTDKDELSLLSGYNIIGIPGVLVFRDGWDKLITNKKVTFCFDNDHPKMVNEKLRPGAAYEGLRKVIDTLMKKEDRPKSAYYLHWGDWLNYDPDIKSGYDVRDFLTDTEDTNIRLHKLLGMIKPVPRGWCDGSIPYIPNKPIQSIKPTKPLQKVDSTSKPSVDKSTTKNKVPHIPKLLIDVSRLSSEGKTQKVSISLPRFPVLGFLKSPKNSPLAFMTKLRTSLSNTNGYHVSNGSTNGSEDNHTINGVKDSDNLEDMDPDITSSQEDSDDGDMSTSLECLPCTSWGDLIPVWHKALKWTEELDVALSVMLSSITSTPMVGDQLWCKIVSAPSCLDGDTLIHNPVDGTIKTVRKRWEERNKFFVWSMKKESLGICEALPPVKHDAVPMYRVTFSSGRTISVTLGHRFWNGHSYVSLESLLCKIQQSSSCRLPTISDIDLLIRQRDALHLKRTVEDYQYGCCACSCLCDGLPLQGEDTFQYVVPSPDDVPDNNHLSYDEDDLDTLCRCTPQLICHSSSGNAQNHGKGQKIGLRSHSLSEETLLSSYSCQILWHNQQGLPQIDNTPVTSEDVHLSNNAEFRSREFLVCGKHSPAQPSVSWQSPSDCNQIGKDQCTFEVYHHSKDVSTHGGTLFHGASDICGPLLVQHASHKLPLQEFCHFDKEPQLEVDEPQTMQQPYVTPVNVVNLDLGELTLSNTDEIVNIEYIGEKEYFDFHVPETRNYWTNGFFHHNSGKSVLCEALSVAKKFCIAKSTIRGFHSGYKVDKTGSVDTSLIAKLKNKTLIIKDGDTLLRAPNLDQILSEARDIYDRISRTDFRNNMCRSYEGLSMTWILCGTASLHALDSSELGERFLDCVIVDKMAVELEREIAYAKALQAAKEIQLVVEGNMKTLDGPEMLKAKQLTGGYVEYLRMNCPELIRSVNIDPHTLKRCSDLAEFVSFIRTKPSKTQEETVQRELCFRLTSQLTRLSGFLAVVMNKTERDSEVMRRTEKVAMDTCRGKNLQVARFLFNGSRLHGTSLSHLADLTQETDAKLRTHLRFLSRLDVVETFQYSSPSGTSTRPRYRLTSRFHELYRKIFGSK